MDGNKDEAIKSFKIAKNSIKSGLNKARRSDPSMETHESSSELNEDKNPNKTTNEKPFNPVTSSSSSEVAKKKKEHFAVIREIERKKDYYEILGLEKISSTAEDIRKAYRKLSLKVHPDKNRAPGAEDSFKKVSKAFQCLSNEESRRKYDFKTSSPANKRVRVSETGGSVSRSRSGGIMEYTIILVSFGVNANVMFMFNPPWSMKTLMMMLRDRVTMFNLSGSFRLKYEYQGKMIRLPEEDDLEADNELRTCICRLKSLGELPMLISVEFI